MAIVKGAGLVMKAIIEEGDAEIAAKMRDLALAEGALPRHLHTAMFTQSTDSRILTVRQLSRHLVGLCVTGHPTTMALLKRIMPTGLLTYLDSTDDMPYDDVDRIKVRDNLKLAQEHENCRRKNLQWKIVEKQIENFLLHWKAKIGLDTKLQQASQEKLVVLRKHHQRIKSEANCTITSSTATIPDQISSGTSRHARSCGVRWKKRSVRSTWTMICPAAVSSHGTTASLKSSTPAWPTKSK